MSNTYTQIHIQCIFAPKFRQALITNDYKDRLHQYITGIIRNHDHKMIAINSMPDHLHMFFGMRPNQSLSDLMRVVKGDSSEWINSQNLTRHLFRWQESFGAFSYEKKTISTVAAYIENQEYHHRKMTFLEEYRQLLDRFEIDYDPRYLFKEPV